MSKQGADKRPFICKEDPSNNFPVQKLQSADNKEGKGTSRWGHALVNSTGLNKVAKWEDNFSTPQRANSSKKDETDSSIRLNSSPSITYVSGLFDKDGTNSEADVHVESETRTAKPEGSVLFIVLFSVVFFFFSPKLEVAAGISLQHYCKP